MGMLLVIDKIGGEAWRDVQQCAWGRGYLRAADAVSFWTLADGVVGQMIRCTHNGWLSTYGEREKDSLESMVASRPPTRQEYGRFVQGAWGSDRTARRRTGGHPRHSGSGCC